MPYDNEMDRVEMKIMIIIDIHNINRLKMETKLVAKDTQFCNKSMIPHK